MEFTRDQIELSIDNLTNLMGCIDNIEHWLGGVKDIGGFYGLFKSYGGTESVAASVMMLHVIGELVRATDDRTNKQLFCRYPMIPWRQIIGMRNFIAHEYFKLDYDEVWDAITAGLPPLKEAVSQILKDLQAELDKMPMEE